MLFLSLSLSLSKSSLLPNSHSPSLYISFCLSVSLYHHILIAYQSLSLLFLFLFSLSISSHIVSFFYFLTVYLFLYLSLHHSLCLYIPLSLISSTLSHKLTPSLSLSFTPSFSLIKVKKRLFEPNLAIIELIISFWRCRGHNQRIPKLEFQIVFFLKFCFWIKDVTNNWNAINFRWGILKSNNIKTIKFDILVITNSILVLLQLKIGSNMTTERWVTKIGFE